MGRSQSPLFLQTRKLSLLPLLEQWGTRTYLQHTLTPYIHAFCIICLARLVKTCLWQEIRRTFSEVTHLSHWVDSRDNYQRKGFFAIRPGAAPEPQQASIYTAWIKTLQSILTYSPYLMQEAFVVIPDVAASLIGYCDRRFLIQLGAEHRKLFRVWLEYRGKSYICGFTCLCPSSFPANSFLPPCSFFPILPKA